MTQVGTHCYSINTWCVSNGCFTFMAPWKPVINVAMELWTPISTRKELRYYCTFKKTCVMRKVSLNGCQSCQIPPKIIEQPLFIKLDNIFFSLSRPLLSWDGSVLQGLKSWPGLKKNGSWWMIFLCPDFLFFFQRQFRNVMLPFKRWCNYMSNERLEDEERGKVDKIHAWGASLFQIVMHPEMDGAWNTFTCLFSMHLSSLLNLTLSS